MKTKYSLLFSLVFCSLNGYSAFNAVENSQLEDINSKSQKEVEKTISSLDDAQNFKIKNNPEKKILIDRLRKAWDITIKRRCDLETSESKRTDAEISAVNTCLVKGYKEEVEYFNNILP